MREITVNSISEYIQEVCTLSSELNTPLWFRGIKKSDTYKLIPTLYRDNYKFKDEANLLQIFRARAVPYLKRIPDNDYEWLFVMQHFGLPTRLLDWSEEPIPALGFALIDKLANGENSAVFVLSPLALNKKNRFLEEANYIPNVVSLSSEFDDIYKVNTENTKVTITSSYLPIAIIGPLNNERIVAQKGAFTLFPKYSNSPYSDLECQENQDDYLVAKIIIPNSALETFQKELKYLGITKGMLFPSLEETAKQIKIDYERA